MSNNAELKQQWDNFCDKIRLAGHEIIGEDSIDDEVAQAEVLRYVTRLIRSGVEKFVENWDPEDPFFCVVYNDRLKWGLDNPDSIYATSAVDGRYEYEVTGNIGTVPYFNLTAAEMDTNAKLVITAFLDGDTIKTDADGNFSIQVGGEKHSENWLPLTPDANSVMFRETFRVRSEEQPMRYSIRLVTDIGPDRPMTIPFAFDRLEKAGDFVLNTGKTFLGLGRLLAANTNGLPAVDEELMKTMGGDPNYFYYWSAYKVEADEALLIHLPEVPECENWGLCIYDYWLESLDYTRSPINVNKYTSQPNADGSVTLILTDLKPEAGNWLSTQGHVNGNMMFRWTSTKKNVAPITQLVKRDSIEWQQVLQRWPI